MSRHLINQANVKKLALEIARQSPARNIKRKTQVSADFLDAVAAALVADIHARIHHHDNKTSSRITLK